MTTTASDLVQELEAGGVRLWDDGDHLRFRAAAGALTAPHRSLLREHRDAVLEHLRQRRGEVPVVADPSARHEPFPLSDIQAAYLLGRGGAFDYGNVACHAYLEVGHPADTDPDRLVAAWWTLVRRHDMLRAVVHPDGYQQVLPDVEERPVEVTDLRGAAPATVHDHVAQIRDDLAQRVADPQRWPLFALRLTRTDDALVLHLSVDLLVLDFAGLQIVLAELEDAYHGRELPPIGITFRDHLLARRRAHSGPGYDRDRAYWLDRIPDLPGPPQLPVTAAPADAGGFVRFSRTVTPEARQRLRGHAAAHGVTESAALLTAYAETVGRWSATDRFCLNVPTFARTPRHPDVDRLVGDFTAVELLAVDLREHADLATRARTLGTRLVEDLRHPLFSGSEVLAELNRRSPDGTVLMPVVYTSTLGAGPVVTPSAPVRYAVTQTPQVFVDCQVLEHAGGLQLSWDVRDGVLDGDTARDMFGAFTTLVDDLSADPATWSEPARIPLPPHTAQVRAAVEATAGPLPDGLLHEPVFAQAARTPDAVAVRDATGPTTYRDLTARARAVAHALHRAGVTPGELVGIRMDKGVDQVVGVLGTLLAGAAYLPVDTNQPALRRDTILGGAGVRMVLTQSWVDRDYPLPGSLTRIDVDTVLVDGEAPGTEPPPATTDPDDLAYVIHTSGSSGTPKGVMISHRAARNTVDDINRRFAVAATDRVLGLAQLGFDLSVYDIVGPLAVGGTLVLPDADGRGDPAVWAALVAGAGVTIWNSVPAQLQMLHDYLRASAQDLGTLRLALLSGDWIPLALPDQIRALVPGLALHSLGGATEASIWSIGHPIDVVDPTWRSVPYGTALTNQTVRVLDSALRPCPDGVTGEIHIGGAGVALGYLGDPDRTAERFVRHPDTGERLYRTGDLGRHYPDGAIEFLGRTDQQVKLRGYRIELGEVAAALDADPCVGASAVLIDGAGGAAGATTPRSLVAFVEPARRSAPLPIPDAVPQAAHTALRTAGASLDTGALAAFLSAMDDAATLSIADAVAPGVGPGASRTAAEVAAALGAAGNRERLVGRWLGTLAAHGRLRRDGPGFRDLIAPGAQEIAAAWSRAAELERAAGWSPHLFAAVRRCAAELGALLRGARQIEELLFTGGAEELAAAYRGNAVAAALQDAVVAVVGALAADRPGPLRVLEIGLRGGGAAAGLLPALPDADLDYLATDPSPLVRAAATELLAADGRVRVAEFDITAFDPADPAGVRAQGLLPNSADVLICAGVLNNAPDVDAALARIDELLVPGGWLLLVENTDDASAALQVSTEFLDAHAGPFTDDRARDGQVFLRTAQWRDALARRGAVVAAELPRDGDGLAVARQRLFVARLTPGREPVDTTALARAAARRLPEYMVPTRWQVVDALPTTANGKIDQATLTGWLSTGTGAAVSEAPMDELETALARLWSELLDGATVGRSDDLFALGGDSLLVARLVGRLRDGIDAVDGGRLDWDLEWEVVLRHLLRTPTVAGLAGYLRGVDSTGRERTGSAPAGPVVPLAGGDGDGDTLTVLVHAGTGTLLPYRPLVTELRARAGDGLALAGLEIGSVEEFLAEDPDGLVDRLAAGYAAALLRTGHRRFHVVGYCIGGVIATEVARGLAESGADVASLTVISSHSPTFRIDDELLSEYSFALMMGMDLERLGFPADQQRVGAAAAEVLARTPDAIRDGALAGLRGGFSDVGEAFTALESLPRMRRVTAMCAALPDELAGTYEPEGMLRALRIYQQSIFALSRHRADPYVGDITFLRHRGAYPFPGTADSITEHWARLCLGELASADIPGHHFTCMTAAHVAVVCDRVGERIGVGR